MTSLSARSCLLVLLLMVSALGCASDTAPGDTAPGGTASDDTAPRGDGARAEAVVPGGDDAAPAPSGTSERPATRHDSLVVEGTPQPVTLHLFVAPDSIPAHFSTYYPDDMLAQVIQTGQLGVTVRFTAHFGGTLRDDAMLQYYAFPAGMQREGAHLRMRELAQENGAEHLTALADTAAWMLDSYAFEGNLLAGSIALGEHGGRYFYIMQAYPPEFADGFAPRARRILDAWRWTDTGKPLG